eukprot:GHVU01060424.1.p1 GENE.GHVU01060424.1~~GHVU01060424.1.p1  ORF type:complete len:116 (+),score=0.78 GHVU01060424.1:343-690(+)
MALAAATEAACPGRPMAAPVNGTHTNPRECPSAPCHLPRNKRQCAVSGHTGGSCGGAALRPTSRSATDPTQPLRHFNMGALIRSFTPNSRHLALLLLTHTHKLVRPLDPTIFSWP